MSTDRRTSLGTQETIEVGEGTQERQKTTLKAPHKRAELSGLEATLDSIDDGLLISGLEQTLDGSDLEETVDYSDPQERGEDRAARGISEHTSLGLRPLSYGLKPGDRLEHFEVLRELGRGGMGTVYEAFNHTLSRRVALKVLHVKESASLEALKSEARSIAQLEHPNIVQVFHLGELEYEGERALYIEMQLVAGRPLNQLIEQEELGLPRCINLLIQILEALQHAHGRGVIHRDVKPDNVIVTPEGVVKLVDFGISAELNQRAGRRGASRAGTPAYMSPEVWTEGDWSVQSDLYAFGVSAYWMLSGRFPFEFSARTTWQEVMELHLNETVRELELSAPLPTSLNALLMSCLEKDPTRRPQSARELIDELERHQEELSRVSPEQVQAERQSWWSIVTGWVAQRRRLLITVALLNIIHLLSLYTAPLRSLDDDALDLLQSLQPAPTQLPVGLVALDEAAYMNEELHLNRESLAGVLRALFKGGAKAVGVDLIQSRPSPRKLELRDHWWQEVARDPRVALSVAPSKVIGAQRSALHSSERALLPKHGIQLLFDQRSPDPDELSLGAEEVLGAREQGLKRSQAKDRFIETVNPAQERFDDESMKRARNRYLRLHSVSTLVLPYPKLLEATNALGHISLQVDEDGVIRKVPLLVRYEDKVFPSLGLLVAMRSLGAGLGDLDYLKDTVIISPPGRAPIYIPVDMTGAMSLRVRGEPNHRPQLPLLSVTQAEEGSQLTLNAESYLLGATAMIAGDWGRISHWRHVPKSFAHVVAAENILNQDFIYPLRQRWLFAITSLLSLLAFLVTYRSKAEWRVIVTIASLGCTLILCLWLLLNAHRELPLVTLSSQVALSCLFAMTLTELKSRQAQRALTDRLGEALPPRVAQAIIEGSVAPTRLVKPQRRLITMVCVELAPLDQLADQLPPKALTHLLDQFNEDLQRIALQHGGLMVPSRRSATLIAFLRSSGKRGSADALRFTLELSAAWKSEVWRWQQERRAPSLNLTVGQGRCAWGTLSVTRRSELGVQGSFVERLESLSSFAQGQILIMAEVTEELKTARQGQHTLITLKAREGQPRLSLTLSPGPSLSAAQREEGAPLTCYYLTASHQG